MDITTLENWLWEAACSIRGPLDAPKYKDYILPLLFYKRLSDVYEDELQRLSQELGSDELARRLAQADRDLIRFYIPEGCTWPEVRRSPLNLGERLTEAMREIARENSRLQGVIDIVDFNATAAGQRILDDDTLARLMEILNQHRLGLDDVEPDILGRAYEYLLRKFAEGSGQSAGEFYTPMEVGTLMAYILDPEEGETVYDPACGSGGLLIKAQLRLREKVAQRLGKEPRALEPSDIRRPLRLFGQEINHLTRAIAEMNAIIHDMEAEIALGDTMRNPRFLDEDGSLRTFDKVTANPMWNQKFGQEVYENDTFGRFTRGTPPSSSADWGWIQHMFASLNEGGKMAVVLDTGAVSRGSGNQGSNRERDIRRAFVEEDLIEAVILLPENLFYNTTAPGIILVINKVKPHPGEILLVNASKLYAKGRPKNYLTEEHIRQVYKVYHDWRAEEGVSTVITTQEAARNDYNLSPSRYVATNDVEPPLPLEEALVLLAQAEEERAEADAELEKVLAELGLEGWRAKTSRDGDQNLGIGPVE
ncbi:MAG TPA: SAM-dependent DNA methyltransferase [Thermoflexia bacterium]|nr:SAM-dependent DNA methyltransferase [Thermoflexia bacterium]